MAYPANSSNFSFGQANSSTTPKRESNVALYANGAHIIIEGERFELRGTFAFAKVQGGAGQLGLRLLCDELERMEAEGEGEMPEILFDEIRAAVPENTEDAYAAQTARIKAARAAQKLAEAAPEAPVKKTPPARKKS